MVNPLHSLQAAPALKPSGAAAAPAPADVTVSYNAQDEVVFGATPTTIPNATTQGGLQVEKAKLNDRLAPNADGQYVYDASDKKNLTAAISFAAAAKTISAFEQALGEPINWAFGAKQLEVNADAGEDFNAYYARDEKSINFFHGTDPKTSETIMSGASGEVVSHEAGHAMLDAIRPAYFSSWTPDVGAFHESFGDMIGMMMAFQDERSVKLAAEQTGGDLSKPNCIAATGEQLGKAINDYVGQNATGGDYVRNAINNFKWAEPSTLPDYGGPDELGSEVHSFSRLWTGAFYDIVQGLQCENMTKNVGVEAALKCTGDEMTKILANAMKEAPQADFTFRDMANAWIAADQKYNDGKNVELMTKVFTDRGILGGEGPAPTPGTPDPDQGDQGHLQGITTLTADGRKPLTDVTRPVYVRLSGPEFGMFQGARVETLVEKDGSLMKDAETAGRVKSNVAKAIAQGRVRYNDPSYKMKIPQDLFDAQGRPYVGVTRWENGQMIIERNKVAN